MAKITKYVNDLTLRIGPLSTTGYLTGVRKSAAKSGKVTFKSTSPTGEAVKQVYQDADGNIFNKSELGKATVVETVTAAGDKEVELVPVDLKAIAEAEKSALNSNVVTLTVHPAAQVNHELYHSEANGYVFTPHDEDDADRAYAELLLKVIESDPSKAYLSVANVRSKEALFRLTAWNGNLVLQRVLYPHEVNEYEVAGSSVKIDSATFDKACAWITNMSTPFDPDEYRNNVTERLAAMEAAFVSGEATVTEVMPVEKVEFDLSAALDAFEAFS